MDWDILENTLNLELLTQFSFGAFIRKKREEKNMTVKDLAKEMNVSNVYISDIERGNRMAPNKEDFLVKLFRTLNVTPEEEKNLRTMILISRNEGIDEYLSKTPVAKVALRMADEANAPDTVWLEFMNRLRELNADKDSEE
jgi:transcriptional regulator with XRE-family HTH domain